MSQIKLLHSGGNGVSIVAPDSNPASDRILKLPSDGDGTILTTNSSVGKILQVVSATKTDTFTSTSAAFAQITGLSINITPTASTSKILVYFSVDASNTNSGATSCRVAVFKDGSNYLGSNISNRVRGWQLANYGDNNTGEHIGFQFLDNNDAGSTSQITYDCRIASQGSTSTINRSGSDIDNADYGYRSASTITAMEVAA